MVRKIKREIKNILNKCINDCHFSILLALTGIWGSTLGRFIPSINQRCTNYRNRFILKYMDKLLKDVNDKYRTVEEEGIYSENAPIWVCWWTGVEDAPEIVKKCVNSIYRAAGKHPVHVITQDNYSKYLEIPSYIIEKVQAKRMCIANFSDYLRVSLLEKYGGLWLDATIYVSRKIPDNIFMKNLFTCTSPGAKGYLADGRWTSYCIGGYKGHLFFEIAKEMFEMYWKEKNLSIDYLLVDYIFNMIYENNVFVKTCFDSIPINNMQRNDLARAMVRGIGAEQFETIVKEDTIFYKLSWREKYPLKTPDGKESIYKYFLEQM